MWRTGKFSFGEEKVAGTEVPASPIGEFRNKMAEEVKMGPDEWGVEVLLESAAPEYRECYDLSVAALKETLEIVESENWKAKGGPWKLQQERPNGDKVFAASGVQPKNKTFATVGAMPMKAEELLKMMWEELSEVPTWNNAITEYRRLVSVASTHDITYTVFNEYAGGVISSRDFVDSRCWRKVGESFCLAGQSMKLAVLPNQKGKVRGEHGAGLMMMTDIADSPSPACHVTLLQNTDLKGLIPKSLVEKAIAGTMLNYFEDLRKKIQNPKN